MHRRLLLAGIVFLLPGCHRDGPVRPLLSPGLAHADGRLGAFRQNGTGDCFFLTALLALAQDADGIPLIESSFAGVAGGGVRQIVFPNLPDQPIAVGTQELNDYRLLDSEGTGLSPPARGDPDIALLEIAADKLWKSRFKQEGLWDDVPMNAVYLFSAAPQYLLWNRAHAAPLHNRDIDQYRRFAGAAVIETAAATPDEVLEWLRRFAAADRDGISMIWIDYIRYHAVAITEIDFDRQSFRYIDTDLKIRSDTALTDLVAGIVNGQFAVNYLEVGHERAHAE
ncbi:MAG: hypothetical protein ACU84J_00510 [Gammaproteobacteria bacterium]